MKQLLLPALALALLTQCQKSAPAPDPAKPEDQLPPATQTGAGTFGCFIDGQPWTPKGYDGTPNFRLSYDAGYDGGSLQIKAYRYVGNGNNKFLQAITFGKGSITKAGVYPFTIATSNGVQYDDTSKSTPCNWYGNPRLLVYQSGSLTLTRFDLSARVISGTFNFKLYQPGCDTLKITQGRFDYTL
jgi:hypothetical protein